jgi:hypothetical protein
MKKTSVVVAVSAVMMTAAVMMGCDDGGGPGRFMTSVPANKPINTLSSGEIATLCADAETFVTKSAFHDDLCRLDAFLATTFVTSSTSTDAELSAACTSAYNACVADVTGSTATCDPPPATCTATVGELTACANDEAAQFHEMAAKLPTCAGITRAAVEAQGSAATAGFTAPASCLAYQTKCSDMTGAMGGV